MCPIHKTRSSEYTQILGNHESDPFDHAYLIPKFPDQLQREFGHVVAILLTNVTESQVVATGIHANQESDPSDLVTDQVVLPI